MKDNTAFYCIAEEDGNVPCTEQCFVCFKKGYVALTDEQLIECYHIVFSDVHSEGFMIAEMSDLITQEDYTFLSTPNGGWETTLREYLHEIGYNFGPLEI